MIDLSNRKESSVSDLESFKGKKILIIGPNFFGYSRSIADTLISLGASVWLCNDRPNDSFLTKSIIRISRALLSKKTDKYYDKIISEHRDKDIDYILVIRGEAISATRVNKMRLHFRQAKIILYLWDSMYYNPNALNIMNLFDRVFSFDYKDTLNYPDLRFIPLFFTEHFTRTKEASTAELDYDLCFVGTVHTDRYKILNRVMDDCIKKEIRFFMFCYYPSNFLAFLRGLFDPGFRHFSKRYVSFVGLNRDSVVDIFNRSACVLDINRPEQQGLTIRSLETLGARRKLITTNTDIKDYPAFGSNNVMIISREEPSLDLDFLKIKLQPRDSSNIDYYSINMWLKRVFLDEPL